MQVGRSNGARVAVAREEEAGEADAHRRPRRILVPAAELRRGGDQREAAREEEDEAAEDEGEIEELEQRVGP